MKKILIVTAFFHPHIGGLESYTLELSKELIKRGYQVSVVTNNTENINVYEQIEGITIFRISNFMMIFNNSGGLPFPKINKQTLRLLKQIKQDNYSLIITNTRFFTLNHLILYYLNYPKQKVIHIEHGSGNIQFGNKFNNLFSLMYDFILLKLLKYKIKSFYGVSKKSSDFLLKYIIISQGNLHSGVTFNCNVPNKGNNNLIHITFVGRLIYEKGITYLLEAFEKLNSEKTFLHVIGDGLMYEKLIISYKHMKNIKFYGSLEASQVQEMLSTSHIFINPSFAMEGGPRTILEAGINKCAVISTNVGFVPDVIKHLENGLIIDKKNSDDILMKLNFLIENFNFIEVYGNKLFKEVKNNYSWNETVNQIEKQLNIS